MNRAILASLLVAHVAAADRITVKVVDAAGDTAFVEPGRAAGLVPGTKVTFGPFVLVVVEATEKTASIATAKITLAIGDTGVAIVKPGKAEGTTERLPPPRALDTFKDQWPDTARPAESQTPTPVPLGAQQASGSAHLAIYGHMFGNLDKAGSGGQIEARVVSSFDILSDRPLGADFDGALRLFGTGWNSAERTPVFVRAAQLRYGDSADPSFVVGRLRYAATSLGMLDGGRAAVHTGNFEIAAFGGLVPDPISGRPDTGAARFGGELIYDRASSPWQPRLAIAAHGSTWDGALDEQRLSIAATASHGATWLDGWIEAQRFASDNPWGAPGIDITGAGASGEWRHRGKHIGVDFTFLRPERSLRLASLLDPSWLCARDPQPGNVMETCLGQDFWTSLTTSAGLSGERWSIDTVGSIGATTSITTTLDASGYVRAELGSHAHRLVLATSGGQSSFAAWVAADAGFALSPSPRFDVMLTYRPEQLDYSAATGSVFMQSLVADLHVAVASALDVAVSAVGTTGADRDVLALLTTIVWRPLP